MCVCVCLHYLKTTVKILLPNLGKLVEHRMERLKPKIFYCYYSSDPGERRYLIKNRTLHGLFRVVND